MLVPANMSSGGGINSSSVLYTLTTYNGSVTPTNDCYAMGTIGGTNAETRLYIDGTSVLKTSASNTAVTVSFPVKAGQTISADGVTGHYYSIAFFGILK